ncbi:MAG TPA: SCP2 sterol-binding domain-containing protein [Burkholderiales bacterium]|nr:SCP2 sterol-binding domain-containing protein [Burkholderiales bacterium]
MSLLPGIFAPVSSLWPPTPHSVLLAVAVNRILARCIEPGQFLPLADKTVCICVTDVKLKFYIGANRHNLVARRNSPSPDLTIAASARDFLKLALREEDPDTLFFGRRLSMEGDTELGLLIKNLLDSVDPSRLLMVCWLPETLRSRIRAKLLS